MFFARFGWLLALAAVACAHPRPRGTPPSPRTSPTPARLRLALGAHDHLTLLDASETKTRLATRDDFIAALVPLDRKLRLRSAGPVSETAFLASIAGEARSFSPAQIERLRDACARISEALTRAGLDLDLGADVELALTTGREEAGAQSSVSYTRAGVIYLNEAALDEDPASLLAHELFHVFSYRKPALRERLYGAIGFIPIGRLHFPSELDERRVTTPEVPFTEHAIRVRYQGHEELIAPVSASTQPYRGEELFAYAASYYVIVDPAEDGARVRPGSPLLTAHQVEGFFEQVGRNTAYLAGPEEILADNLQVLLLAPERVRTPAPVEALREVMKAREK